MRGWPREFSRESGPGGGWSAALQLSRCMGCVKLAVRRMATRRLRTLHATDENPRASERAGGRASGRAGGQEGGAGEEAVRAGALAARHVRKDFCCDRSEGPSPQPISV